MAVIKNVSPQGSELVADAASRCRPLGGGGTGSVLPDIEQRLALLDADPAYRIDARLLGQPGRKVTPSQLRRWLLDRSTSFAARDAVLGWLVEQARTAGGDWPVVLLAVLSPGIRRLLSGPCRRLPSGAADLAAEAVAGLLATVEITDPARGRLAASLTWSARRAADRLLAAELREPAAGWDEPVDFPAAAGLVGLGGSGQPQHVDLLLAEAVTAGVLSVGDADLIVTTRLDGERLEAVAETVGLSYAAACKRRQRAEAQLRCWLLERLLDADPALPAVTVRRPAADGFVRVDGVRPGSCGGGRPRQGRRPDHPVGGAPTDRTYKEVS